MWPTLAVFVACLLPGAFGFSAQLVGKPGRGAAGLRCRSLQVVERYVLSPLRILVKPVDAILIHDAALGADGIPCGLATFVSIWTGLACDVL